MHQIRQHNLCSRLGAPFVQHCIRCIHRILKARASPGQGSTFIGRTACLCCPSKRAFCDMTGAATLFMVICGMLGLKGVMPAFINRQKQREPQIPLQFDHSQPDLAIRHYEVRHSCIPSLVL